MRDGKKPTGDRGCPRKGARKIEKKGPEIQPKTLEYAEYVIVLGSADWRFASADSILDL